MNLRTLKVLRFFHLINKKNYNEKRQIEIVKSSPMFDAKWYLEQNQDVKAKKIGAAKHYVKWGWKEGRDPSKEFSTKAYLEQYPELLEKNWCPVFHYMLFGHFETVGINKECVKEIYPLLEYIGDPIEFKKCKKPQVSIIIPVYNNYYYTKLCLQSILLNTHNIDYEVIIADDNSTDETMYIEKCVKNIKVIHNKTNLRFLKNCNNAARYAQGEYICFLNNDTQVQSLWLDYLLKTLQDNSVGLVGSKLIYPDGTLQEAGGIIYSDASGCNYGRGDDPSKLWYNYTKEVDYISGASILLKTSLWKELGGFDETFCPAYYEDTDLAFRIRYEKGKKVVYQPKSVVIHFEGKSNGTSISDGQKRYQHLNREKFYKKWKKELIAFHETPGSSDFLAREHAKNKKNILVIDWKILSFTKDTGSRTTYQYMKFFRDMGMNVKFYPHDWYLEDDFLTRHLEDGFEVIHQNFKDYIKAYGHYFDYVYLNRPGIAKCYIDDLRKYTRAKIIYQCHDLHYLRQYRNRLLTAPDKAENLYQSEKNEEFSIFRKMDVVCSFSFDEIQEIEREDSYINAEQIPLYILDSSVCAKYHYDASKRKDIMFVAGFQHQPNIDGAVWFAKKIFPHIKRKNPNMKFYIVGSNPTKEVLALKSKDIIVTGYVSDEELEKYYSKIKLVVVPLRSGAGVKGKIIESIYHKVPVVTTDIGIEGINNLENLIFIQNEEKNFAKQVINLYKNNELLNKTSKKSEYFIEKYFSSEAVVDSLGKYIDFESEKSFLSKKSESAPVALFVYNRLEHPKKVIESLLKNPEAKDTDLYVFSDGGKYLDDIPVIKDLRHFLKTVKGFNSVKVIERKTNYGLAINLIDGISAVLEEHENCIVLEDDIVVAPNFLAFMNQALNTYKNNKQIFTIQSTTGNSKLPGDCCCRKHPNCQGWAIWKDRWAMFERIVPKAFCDINADDMLLRKEINVNNSVNISWQIDANLRGERTTWAIYLNYTSFKFNKLNIYPKHKLVKNIGQDGTGIHGVVDTTSNLVADIPLWNKNIFDLPAVPKEDMNIADSNKDVDDYNENLKKQLTKGEYEKYLHRG